MSTITVRNEPDDIVAIMAEVVATRARQIGVDDVSIYVHNGELSHVTVGDRTYFHMRGEYYEVVDVRGLDGLGDLDAIGGAR